MQSPVHAGWLFQQNHDDVWRSRDAGESWENITLGLPSSFGFPIVIHPREPETIYVLPLVGAEMRCPPEGKLRVYRSRDGGSTWAPLIEGLPQEQAYVTVYRDAMATDGADPAGLYFGTTGGHLYYSRDEGDHWEALATTLPPILSVEAAVVG